MASVLTFPTRTLGQRSITIDGSFAPNGVSAIVAASNEGVGFTVARTGVGVFLITFTDKFPALISGLSKLQLATGDDKDTQLSTFTQADKTLEVRVWDKSAAAVADVAVNANNRINFSVTFSNSSV